MKHLKLTLTILLFTSCSHQNQIPSKPAESNYTQKNALFLPDEDMQLLKNHNPQILKKIKEPTPINIDDIISMQQLGFTSDILIRIINHTQSRFQLTTADVLRLQAEGVPFKVINYMIRT
ncbi:MAG: hypothetical protein FJZ59_00175 [Chlamydiae bacterium]|jgi:hypothetical protein|nr:hypothetical protein [Chlamydiota bacterium]